MWPFCWATPQPHDVKMWSRDGCSKAEEHKSPGNQDLHLHPMNSSTGHRPSTHTHTHAAAAAACVSFPVAVVASQVFLPTVKCLLYSNDSGGPWRRGYSKNKCNKNNLPAYLNILHLQKKNTEDLFFFCFLLLLGYKFNAVLSQKHMSLYQFRATQHPLTVAQALVASSLSAPCRRSGNVGH